MLKSSQLCYSAGPPMSQNPFTQCMWPTESLTGSPRVSPANGCNLSPKFPSGRGSHYCLDRRRCKQSVSAGQRRSLAKVCLSWLTLMSVSLALSKSLIYCPSVRPEKHTYSHENIVSSYRHYIKLNDRSFQTGFCPVLCVSEANKNKVIGCLFGFYSLIIKVIRSSVYYRAYTGWKQASTVVWGKYFHL